MSPQDRVKFILIREKMEKLREKKEKSKSDPASLEGHMIEKLGGEVELQHLILYRK